MTGRSKYTRIRFVLPVAFGVEGRGIGEELPIAVWLNPAGEERLRELAVSVRHSKLGGGEE